MEKLKQVDRRLIIILLIVFVQILGASMVLPILPLFAQREFAMSPQVITLLVSSFFAAQFLAGPTLGSLSDRYGRLPVLIVSQIGTAVSFVMLALAPNVSILFVARILDGITGGNIIVAQAYVTDITPREKRTQSLGLIFAVFGLGFIFGPALGGVLSAAFGARVPFLIAAAAAMVVVVLTWRMLDETLTPEQREASRQTRSAGSLRVGQIFANRPLLAVLALAFIGRFILGLLQATFALYGEAVLFAGASRETVDLGIGLLLGTVGLGQFFTQSMLLRPLVERFGDAPLVVMGMALRTVGMVIFALAVSPWLAAVAVIFFAVGGGVMMPALQSLSTDTVADEIRGNVLGVYQSSVSLSTILSTAVSGVLFAITPTVPYWIGAALSAVAVVPAIALWRQLTRRKAAEAEGVIV